MKRTAPIKLRPRKVQRYTLENEVCLTHIKVF